MRKLTCSRAQNHDGSSLDPTGIVVTPFDDPETHMMNSLIARLALTASAAALTVAASVTGGPQGTKKLEAGDKAPPIEGVTDWVQGEMPNLSDGVVVVEFWATWCEPCKRAIPHLNALHKQFARLGLKIVGIAADEKTGSLTENVKSVKNFVKSKGDAMGYIVGVDNMGEAKRRYMEAAKIEGIPATFVLGRNGRVLWIGRPSDDRFETVIKLAIQNKFDPILTPKAWETLEAAKRAAALRNFREAYLQIDEVVKMDPPLFGWLIAERYVMTLDTEKNAEAAKQYLKNILPGIAADPYSLQELVQTICKDPIQSERDLDSAMILAQQCRKACGSDPAPGMAMIALVHATKGEFEKAVEIQTAAWLAAVPGEKPEYKRVLDEYQRIRTRNAQPNALLGE